ncbi:MAG: hypothetical protein IJG23_01330 [Clostridia bacterium]|nr:hypothetical protein [Clostridia bacterium]
MEIKRNNIKISANKPQINFDALGLEESEKKALNKHKKIIIATTVVAIASSIFTSVRKVKKKSSKK